MRRRRGRLWRPGVSRRRHRWSRSGRARATYGATAWGQRWRVLIKADMVLHAGREPKLNVRFVLTDINGSPQRIYERIYCGRGDARTA